MPHISVKLFEGRDLATKTALAKGLQAELGRILGCSSEHITVALEEYTLETWGAVYREEIQNNPHLLIPPSYDWESEYLRLTKQPFSNT